jgi:hypothetical protein
MGKNKTKHQEAWSGPWMGPVDVKKDVNHTIGVLSAQVSIMREERDSLLSDCQRLQADVDHWQDEASRLSTSQEASLRIISEVLSDISRKMDDSGVEDSINLLATDVSRPLWWLLPLVVGSALGQLILVALEVMKWPVK